MRGRDGQTSGCLPKSHHHLLYKSHHLLYKLQCYGIRGHLFSWFRDYLSDRTQKVIIGGHSAEWMEVSSGVYIRATSFAAAYKCLPP